MIKEARRLVSVEKWCLPSMYVENAKNLSKEEILSQEVVSSLIVWHKKIGQRRAPSAGSPLLSISNNLFEYSETFKSQC